MKWNTLEKGSMVKQRLWTTISLYSVDDDWRRPNTMSPFFCIVMIEALFHVLHRIHRIVFGSNLLACLLSYDHKSSIFFHYVFYYVCIVFSYVSSNCCCYFLIKISVILGYLFCISLHWFIGSFVVFGYKLPV